MTKRKYNFFDVGFHGDKYLIEVASEYLNNATHFLETGTNVGSTLQFVAKQFPKVQCLSCEPDPGAFAEAQKNTAGHNNVRIKNCDAISFLHGAEEELPARGSGLVCWVDAHGHGFQWPLREEIKFLTERFPEAAIFIDDFKVPGNDLFGYDQYDGQECSIDYIHDSIVGDNLVAVFPSYSQHTSKHHPLRGWCLIRKSDKPAGRCESEHATSHDIRSLVTASIR